MTSEIKEIYEKASESFFAGNYAGALSAIREAPLNVQKAGALGIIAADSLYELGQDSEALEEYVSYLEKYPNGKASNFALFNSAICLKNIGADKEAMEVFALVDKGHENLEEEIADSAKRLAKINLARELVERLKQSATQRKSGSIADGRNEGQSGMALS